TDTFMTDALDLNLVAGESITATYVDPTDPTDTSSDTVAILFSMLEIDEFYAAPNPFDTQVTFGFRGAGVASTMTVIVYNLAGERLWEATATDVTKIVWDGIAGGGKPLANGAYLYVITASDGATTFLKDGKIFIMR
ncbi:gliding motility-associated C-terminal domain-containing protein, partial [Candidatus Bipolaricaulota bacterium]|nr:gliding motility-associated C-terminal domain-containing protein [Candidatus Bipolaricaulota bacterium]